MRIFRRVRRKERLVKDRGWYTGFYERTRENKRKEKRREIEDYNSTNARHAGAQTEILFFLHFFHLFLLPRRPQTARFCGFVMK